MESQGLYRTPPQVGKILGVTADKILAWIANGELKAFNVATKDSKRPRWRVSPAELEAFLARRASTPPEPSTRRRARRETLPRFV